MGKLRVSSFTNNGPSSKKKNATVSLKVVMIKLQRSLSLTKKSPSSSQSNFQDDEFEDSEYVPYDVKEGHFAVIAMDNQNQPTRFVIPLAYLNHPVFLKFLEQAAEEYGFNREGALTLPCRPNELETILSDQWVRTQEQASYNKVHGRIESK